MPILPNPSPDRQQLRNAGSELVRPDRASRYQNGAGAPKNASGRRNLRRVPRSLSQGESLLRIMSAKSSTVETSARSFDYWNDARKPLSCLLFLLPWIAVYEVGILMLADSDPDRIRNGADYWMRSILSAAGLGQILLLPVLVVAIMLTWHLIRKHSWKVRLETQAGMLAESVLLAIALLAVGQLHQLIFLNLQPAETDSRLLTLSTGSLTRAVSYVGAGVYEEVMFRLLLVPLAFFVFRLFEFPRKWAAVMAAISTAFVFALAHHVGPAADAFNLFTFTFRAAAGTFFAAVFFLRGFGITVGCHAAYDLLVGVFLVSE